MTLLYYLSSSHRQRDHHVLAIVLSQLELNIQFLLSYNCRLQPTKLEELRNDKNQNVTTTSGPVYLFSWFFYFSAWAFFL